MLSAVSQRSGRDQRWTFLDRAELLILKAVSADGVVQVRFVAAFPDLDPFSVWLCTRTDAERNALLSLETPIDSVNS
jgi:hypothetical protein